MCIRDRVIVAVYSAAFQRVSAGNDQVVGVFFDLAAQFFQAIGYSGQAVAFLEPEPASVIDGGRALAESRGDRQNGNQIRDLGGIDVDGVKLPSGYAHMIVPFLYYSAHLGQ